MATETKETKPKGEDPKKSFKVGKNKVNVDNVDYFKKVKLRATATAKNHEPGEVFEGSEVLARLMEQKGWAERV